MASSPLAAWRCGHPHRLRAARGRVTFADLVLVAALGDVLLLVWLRDRRSAEHPDGGQVKRVKNYVPRPQQGRVQHQAPDTVPVTDLDERRIPPVAVTAATG